MPLNVRLVNVEVKDPDSGQMIPAGLLGSDALSTINTAKNQAIGAIEQKGAETIASIPSDYTSLSNEVDDLKSALEYHDKGYYLFTDYAIIQNSYPKSDGTFDYYNNWDRTDYIEIDGNMPIYFINTGRTTDNAWYDSSKQIISRFTIEIGNPAVVTSPQNAKYMVVSNLRSKFFGDIYTSQTCYATKEELNEYTKLPTKDVPVEFTLHTGGYVSRVNLSVYETETKIWTSISVSAGDKYKITAHSQNNDYPAAFGVIENGTTGYIPLFLSGYGVEYNDAEVTIPDTVVTLYVNGDPAVNGISIKKVETLTNTEFQNLIDSIDTDGGRLKCVMRGNSLNIKKKSLKTGKDLVVRMGNSSIGNNLFTFTALFDKNNLGPMNDSFEPEAGMSSLSVNQTDWISPYIVRATQNGNGDHPTDKYYTGGNHRSNNSNEGGGKTATEISKKFLVDGITPVEGEIYNCEAIDIFVVNSVNGYNTSKDDGTGRNILQEKIHFHITADRFDVERVIVPLEEIVIETLFGFQVYYPNSSVVFVGGNKRDPFAISSGLNTGNKKTREIIVSSDFEIKNGIYNIDLGDFSMSSYSFSTYNNKTYSSLIDENTTAFAADEEYYSKGYYEFN